MKKFAMVILGLSVLVGCTEHPSVQTIELTGETQLAELPYMRVPLRIAVNGQALYMMDLVSDSMFCHVADYPELTYRYSVVKKGNAPEEAVLSTPFQVDRDCLVFMDGSTSKLFYYDCTDKQEARLLSIKKLEGTSLDFVVSLDSVVYREDLSGASRLIENGKEGKKNWFSIPATSPKQSNAELAYLWRSYMTYDNESGKIAMATQFGDVLEIYDMKNHTSKIIVGEGGEPRKEDQIAGFCDVRWHEGKIYALYLGRKQEDLQREYAQGDRKEGADLIREYDADGNMLRQYHLDHLINGFAVDSRNHRIVGITQNQDDPVIYFDLDV